MSDRPAADSTALDGILVADFSRVLAGPLATMILGDLGADVVKVERPGSGDDTRAWGPPYAPDGESAYFLSVNRNKRSVSLDLGSAEGRRAARDLAVRADVLVENFRSGVARRLGLDHESLSGDNPGLVHARVSGFGSATGASLPGYDFLVQAMCGLMSITGEPSSSPTKTGVAIVDVLTGLNTAIGILAALVERRHSGRGQRVEVSLMSAGLAGLVNQASSFLTAGVVPGRLGNRHPSIAPYEPFETADDPVVVAVGNDRQFAALCEALGIGWAATDQRWRTNPDRVANRDALGEVLTGALRQRTRDEWISTLRERGIPCGPINDVAEAFETAERLGLDPVVSLDRADGEGVRTTASPLQLSRTPVSYRLPPPRLGEDDGLLG